MLLGRVLLFYLCVMKFTAGQLAQLVQGRLEGDSELLLVGPSKIEEAKPGSVCFLANSKYEQYLYDSPAALIIVSEDFKPKSNQHPALLRVQDVYQTVSHLLSIFEKSNNLIFEVHSTASVDKNAIIEPNVRIAPFAVLESGASVSSGTQIGAHVFIGENVKIGKECLIYPGVRIYKDCVIGDRVILHSNTVIGSDGFGFVPNPDKSYKKIAQIGNVVIENDVEIGANCTIDRGTMGSTTISEGCKLDNLIQVAHNVYIGSHTVIAAQTGIAGSTKIGKHCMIGGQVGIAGHLEIADGTHIQAQSGIPSSIKESDKKWYGSPAVDYFSFLRIYNEFKKLPDTSKRLRDLENLIHNHNNPS